MDQLSTTATLPTTAAVNPNLLSLTIRDVTHPTPRLFQRFPNLKLAVPAEEVPMDTYGTNYQGVTVFWP
jgi:hypothetical protein